MGLQCLLALPYLTGTILCYVQYTDQSVNKKRWLPHSVTSQVPSQTENVITCCVTGAIGRFKYEYGEMVVLWLEGESQVIRRKTCSSATASTGSCAVRWRSEKLRNTQQHCVGRIRECSSHTSTYTYRSVSVTFLRHHILANRRTVRSNKGQPLPSKSFTNSFLYFTQRHSLNTVIT
jgi:hypothetical protein